MGNLDLQRYSAASIMRAHPDSSFLLEITGLTKDNAEFIKQRLFRFYGELTKVCLSNGKNEIKTELCSIDSALKNFDGETVLSIPPLFEFNKDRYNFQDLYRIMDRLIAPDGCPWDREQTHASIAKNALEEANELVEAISLSDTENIKKEAGDVLLQGVFHGVIAEKYGEFTAEGVVDALCNKLVTRHTHVFGDDKAASSSEALDFWKAAKAKEKK